MTYRNVQYEVDDLNAIVERYDSLQADIRSIKASAAADVGHKKRQERDLIKEASDLGIPKSLLKKKFKKRDKQAQIAEIDESVEEDDAEVWEEINRDVDEFDSTPLAQAASQPAPKAKEIPVDEDEQADGERVLSRAKPKPMPPIVEDQR